jgi:hypothetical protein
MGCAQETCNFQVLYRKEPIVRYMSGVSDPQGINKSFLKYFSKKML